MTEEESIIERVLEGDVEAFREIVECYEKSIMRLAYQFLRDSEASRDLAQDVFLAAFRKLATYDAARSRFSTWLYTIARNRCRNALRKKRAESRADPPERATEATPATEARRREVFGRLDAALAGLPGRYRRAFVFSELEGLAHVEIARIEAVSVGTVKSRVSRARARLRTELGDLKNDE